MLGEQCDARHAERERSLEARERAVREQLAQRASGSDKTRMPSGPIRLSLKSSVCSIYIYSIYI